MTERYGPGELRIRGDEHQRDPFSGQIAHGDQPGSTSLDVEVSLPHEWHEEPMALDPYSSARID